MLPHLKSTILCDLRFHYWICRYMTSHALKTFVGTFPIFIGPESGHWLPLSLTDLTHSLTNSCLVNLIDVTLACEDNNSKQNLLILLLLLMLMMRNLLKTVWCRFGSRNLVLKLSFCLDFEHKVSRFGQCQYLLLMLHVIMKFKIGLVKNLWYDLKKLLW